MVILLMKDLDFTVGTWPSRSLGCLPLAKPSIPATDENKGFGVIAQITSSHSNYLNTLSNLDIQLVISGQGFMIQSRIFIFAIMTLLWAWMFFAPLQRRDDMPNPSHLKVLFSHSVVSRCMKKYRDRWIPGHTSPNALIKRKQLLG